MSCAILNQLAPPSRLYWIIRWSLCCQVGAVPLDLLDAPHQPDFSAVRLDDGQRCAVGVGVGYGPTIPPAGVREVLTSLASTPDDHFTAGPDCRVMYRAVGALVVLVAVQLSVLGLYLPPVFKSRG